MQRGRYEHATLHDETELVGEDADSEGTDNNQPDGKMNSDYLPKGIIAFALWSPIQPDTTDVVVSNSTLK
jgi:hypothetical protein